MDRVQTKTSSSIFIRRFQKILHLYFTRSSTSNFPKPKLKLTKTKDFYIVSVRGPIILNDFVEDCLKNTETLLFSNTA